MRWIDTVYRLAKERGVSLEKLGEAIDVEGPRFTRWKNGDGEPKLSQAIALAKALGLSLDELFAEELGIAATSARPNPAPTRDEELILHAVRSLNLGTGEAFERLARDGPGRGSPVMRVKAERSLSDQDSPSHEGLAKVDNPPRRGK